MGSALGNNGSRIVRADMYYNDNGVIKTIDNIDVYTNNGGTIYRFPQKEHCLVNLDVLTWQDEAIASANSYITNPITFSSQNQSKTTFGTLTQSEVTSGGSFQVCQGKYWYLPLSYLNIINYGQNVLANSKFTIALTFKQFGNPIEWRNLTWFNNADGIRFEWHSRGGINLYAESGVFSGDFPFETLSSYRDNWVQIIMVIDGTTNIAKGYQNGILQGQVNIRRQLSASNGNFIRLFSQRSGSSTGNYGCPVALRDFQMWDTALTDQEVADLRKWLFL